MSNILGDRVFNRSMTRRDFIWLISATTAGVAGGCLQGCAIDPVSGKKVLVGLSPQQELQIDQQQSPHQFSADYGAVQDPQLNRYINQVGRRLGSSSHRPNMPYSFRAVNANNINAYAFPGGSIGVTRGLLVELDSEAELAGLLGHEVGHVAARHAAEQAGKTMVAQAAVMGGAVVASTKQSGLGNVVAGLGSIGAGALLSRYGRNSERESDTLGLGYMVKTGYNPNGMVELMDVLRSKNKSKPGALQTMFATHPQSEERYQTAKSAVSSKYAGTANLPYFRERYMDNTVALRELKNAIKELQSGEHVLARNAFAQAESHFRTAIRLAPNDYAANVLLAKSLLGQNKQTDAQAYLNRAKRIYPNEAQAYNLSGINKLSAGDPSGAYRDFDSYERLLPGNPNTIFLKGVALENTQNRFDAAREYSRYLKYVQQGPAATYAYQQLQKWGYVQ